MTGALAPVLVYGLGRSGLAVVRRAAAAGTPVSFYEARSAGADIDAALALGSDRVTDVAVWLGAQTQAPTPLVVAAPGVPIDHPDLQRLRDGGAEVIGEVEWVWRQVSGRYVAVTGTAGKGSVTRWCGDTLAGAGLEVAVGGNIEPALAAVARAGATHVVEMSSFQLERCPTFAPAVAVLLNLGEDHIDRHGSVAAYHQAKKNLLANLGATSTLVVNIDDAVLAGWAHEAEASVGRVLRFSLTGPADAHLDATGTLQLLDRPLLHRSELRLRGDHQVANALATALAAHAAGVEHEGIVTGLRAFEGLPGRYADAGTVGRVAFVEDSIATRPLAVAAALKATPRPLVWLAGGQGKGANVSDLKELVAERVDLLITFGASATQFAEAYAGLTEVQRVEGADGAATMRALVERSLQYLRERHAGAGNVLLAPLATSFDQFTDYQARGQAFRQAVSAAAAAYNGGAATLTAGADTPAGGQA
ncbi:MAG: UDP-N-acetylmuramoyl-L-alanine--D-glutamate ligase [Trueperaceae bacterium]